MLTVTYKKSHDQHYLLGHEVFILPCLDHLLLRHKLLAAFWLYH